MLYGGIELGGTKIVCAVGSGPADLRDEIRFPTTTPDEALPRILAFFQEQQGQHGSTPLAALGIGSFGPISLHTDAPDYGYITQTPKPGWSNADIVGTLARALAVPVGFDTDVNVAALGERQWGAAQGLHTFLYFTIGTGIGGGGFSGGQMLHGLVHPEMGHIPLPHDLKADPFPGICPYHGDCFEGLASGPALKARWGVPAETLPPDSPAWALEAHYLALACANFIYTLSPQRIILGGGVMSQSFLFPLIRQKVLALLNGYVQSPTILEHIDTYIVPPALGNQAGILGALALAAQAAQQSGS
jgi:fructokinase